MKNSLKDLKLWQQKRSELPVDGDAQQDWLEMQALLDVHIPAPTPKAAKWHHGFKGIKVLTKPFIAFLAAAAVYTASHFLLSKKQKHKPENKIEKSKTAVRDSILKDSLRTKGDTTFQDSVNIIKQKDSALDKTIESNAAIKRAPGVTSKTEMANVVGKVAVSGANSNGNNKATAKFSVSKGNKPGANSINNNSAGAVRNYNRLSGAKHSSQATIAGSKIRGGGRSTGKSNKLAGNTGGKISGSVSDQKQLDYMDNKTGNEGSESSILLLSRPPLGFNLSLATTPTSRLPSLTSKIALKSPAGKQQTAKQKKEKNARVKNTNLSNLDWGILAGVNSSGSFTPKSQNANFYGRAPIDIFFGLFGNYKITDNWAIGTQIQMFSPQTVTTSYTHANKSKVDSNQSLTITSSQKLYNVTIPIHAIYKVSDNVSIMAGPVLSFPVKQINTSSTLQPAAIRRDSAYFAQVSGVINNTNYQKSFNLGVSGGVSLQFNRLVLGATYLKSISGYKITSDYGSYKSHNGTLQFTIGFKLNRPKK